MERLGQSVSVNKSSIFLVLILMWQFGNKFALLHIIIEVLNDKYLGLPAMVSMDKSDYFQYLIDQV